MNNRNNDIIFTEKQVTTAAVLLLFISFISFVLGYYVGKNRDVLNITKEVIKDSFADQIAVSLYSAQKESLDGSTALLNNNDDIDTNDMIMALDIAVANETIPQESTISAPVSQHSGSYFYAQLIGFGTERAANQCAKRWQMQGFPVIVEKKVSHTAKGKQSTWYQIITNDYADKHELEFMVTKLKKQEKLNDIRIVSRNTSRA